jgi:hypothetical protein
MVTLMISDFTFLKQQQTLHLRTGGTQKHRI